MKLHIVFLGLVALLLVATVYAAPRKPQWARQFSSPFGLNIFVPPTTNASSMIYYSWPVKSQTVNYTQHCPPFLGFKSWGIRYSEKVPITYFQESFPHPSTGPIPCFEHVRRQRLITDNSDYRTQLVSSPCTLYFNPTGIFIAQPELGIQCCSFVPGVGSIPPNFLAPFNFSNVENAPDMWGNQHKCNHWLGTDGFAYWTDVETGEDIQFKDGNTGIFWNFGIFDNTDQPSYLFDLPAADCSPSCFTSAEGSKHVKTLAHLFDHKLAH